MLHNYPFSSLGVFFDDTQFSALLSTVVALSDHPHAILSSYAAFVCTDYSEGTVEYTEGSMRDCGGWCASNGGGQAVTLVTLAFIGLHPRLLPQRRLRRAAPPHRPRAHGPSPSARHMAPSHVNRLFPPETTASFRLSHFTMHARRADVESQRAYIMCTMCTNGAERMHQRLLIPRPVGPQRN